MARNKGPGALLREQKRNDLRNGLRSSTKQGSPFLNLEAEFRNEIYRLAMVSEEPIVVEIADTPPMDHPLLRTCRQIRIEAGGIYYQENKVIFAVRNLDIRNVVGWLDRSSAHHDLFANSQLALTVTPKDRSSWALLRYWAFLYREGRVARLTSASLDARTLATYDLPTRDRLQAVALFDVAEAHLASDFRTFSAALEKHRQNFMAPHETHHRIWWGDSYRPEFAPPLPKPKRTNDYSVKQVPPKASPPMDWQQFRD
jgi:hypothetical protein